MKGRWKAWILTWCQAGESVSLGNSSRNPAVGLGVPEVSQTKSPFFISVPYSKTRSEKCQLGASRWHDRTGQKRPHFASSPTALRRVSRALSP